MSQPQGNNTFQRILFHHQKTRKLQSATIRWKGKLDPGKETIYYGIEYDNENEGKHNGKYKDFQLFHTYFSGSNGSFLKEKVLLENIIEPENYESKLPTKSSDPTNFFTNLRENYPDFFSDGNHDFDLDHIVFDGKKVENVGIGYRKKKLPSITLRNCLINFGPKLPADDDDDDDGNKSIEKFIPETLDLEWLKSVEVIDLSLNLINNLVFLLKLFDRILPKLKHLKISGNSIDFELLESNLLKLNDNLSITNRIEELSMNSTNMKTKNLVQICQLFPNLKKLEVMNNFFSFGELEFYQNDDDLEITKGHLLQHINISYNRELQYIPTWFIKLFPEMKSITANATSVGLENNNLFYQKSKNSPIITYPSITELSIIQSGISELTSFNNMHKNFPNLTHLNYSDFTSTEKNALTKKYNTKILQKELRSLVIAKIPTLKCVNRSFLGREQFAIIESDTTATNKKSSNANTERNQAEMDYLRKFYSVCYDEEDILIQEKCDELHPRIPELVKIYPEVHSQLRRSVDKNSNEKTGAKIKENFVYNTDKNVNLKFTLQNFGPKQDRLMKNGSLQNLHEKLVPKITPINRLALLAKKLFQIELQREVVLILTHDNGQQQLMTDEDKALDFYAPFDHDVVEVLQIMS